MGTGSARLGAAILNQCWDSRDAFFYTVDVQCVDRRAKLITNVERGMDMAGSTIPLRFQQFTGFLPMWRGIATKAQADAMIARNYRADDRLRAAHGVRTLSSQEKMYGTAFSSNPSNWLGSIWIISNYFARKGLSR
ncbi:MGH1-like glycoside hydrolase domain-containing protein [Sphingobium sp.]|uniref:MGH1-like glycoside hydrolase domain-containing protein n=1 Tax=Sphingobium sp. TaxID=1912891 RepID=UPI003B3AC338